jgi:hypothetical protein
MIQVKIVDGFAVGVYQLEAKNKVTAFWNRLFLYQFRIINFDNEDIPVVEGNIYWAWPLGNGRISLVEEIQT